MKRFLLYALVWGIINMSVVQAQEYLGCYKDQGDPTGTNGRDLSGFVLNDSDMTTEQCLSLCRSKGFAFAGTQYSSWCFCGNSYGASGTADNCAMPCSGNSQETCGGTWANSVYRITQAKAPEQQETINTSKNTSNTSKISGGKTGSVKKDSTSRSEGKQAKKTYCPCNAQNYATETECAVSCPSGLKCFGIQCTLPPTSEDTGVLSAPPQNTTCDILKKELEETQKILDAFRDPELLEQAKKKGWDGREYNEKVQEKVFGSGSGSTSTETPSISPMGTDPTTCNIVYTWSKEDYKKHGWPEESYYADQVHEKVHERNCRKTKNPMKYNADMSFPEKLSKEEIEAYTAKIDYLQNVLKRCQ